MLQYGLMTSKSPKSPHIYVRISVAIFRSSVSQDSSRSRWLPRSISASITVISSASTGVVPKVNLRQREASFSNIAMHVDSVVAFACIRR